MALNNGFRRPIFFFFYDFNSKGQFHLDEYQNLGSYDIQGGGGLQEAHLDPHGRLHALSMWSSLQERITPLNNQ